ncbi:MAG: AMP-binding protein [Chloroflexota bacterium]
MPLPDTLPKILISTYQKYGPKKVAMRHKDLGIWRSYNWKDSYEQVKYLCLGLIQLGLQRGNKVCIIGDNDPQYFWAQLAIQAGGGVAVGIFTDSNPTEIFYIVDHSDAGFIFAKDQEQCDKLLEIKEQLPKVKRVIYWDDKGLWNYDEPWMISFEALQELGRELEIQQPELFETHLQQGSGDDIAIFCYTSGTTGVQKGTMISHANLISGAELYRGIDPRTEYDEYVSFLPPAWITENTLGLATHLITGMKVNFPEAPETVQENIREIAPHALLFSARLWESLVALVQVKMSETTWLNRWIYKLFMPIGHQVARLRYEQHKPINWGLCLLYALGNVLLFNPLRDKLGLIRVKSAYSSGAALNPDVIGFFRAIGVNIKQLYGSTEAQAHTLHIGEDVKFESVGVPIPGMKIKTSEQGEILVSGPTVFQGYYKNPKATSEAIHKDQEGNRWFHTGDAGFLDADGHLIYLDRMKEMLNLASGEKFSPQFIEGQLKFSPYIRDVMSIGGEDKAFVSALINIDFDNVGRWAEKRGLAYTTYVDLSQKAEVYDLIREDVRRVNRSLPPAANIQRFVLLHKEFDADEGELTRTRKLRRNLLIERYQQIIQAMYAGEKEVHVRAPVKYRDGREGVIETSIRIAAPNQEEVE